jgi:hypothetical protein
MNKSDSGIENTFHNVKKGLLVILIVRNFFFNIFFIVILHTKDVPRA